MCGGCVNSGCRFADTSASVTTLPPWPSAAVAKLSGQVAAEERDVGSVELLFVSITSGVKLSI
jgi:hypothetical protein